MLGVLGRRGVEAAISVFALLGFCYVPLGKHTGLEHAKAVFTTPAAKRAGGELAFAFRRVQQKLTGEALDFSAPESSAGQPSPSAPRHADKSGATHRPQNDRTTEAR